MTPRFTFDRQPYDEDRYEMVCTDLVTGESYDLPMYAGWQTKMREWIEKQVAKTRLMETSSVPRCAGHGSDTESIGTVDARFGQPSIDSH